MSAHDIGDVVTIWAAFRDAAGTQAAPTLVTLTALAPGSTDSIGVYCRPATAGEETQAETAMDTTLSGVTGVYRADLEVDVSGVWRYEWFGQGAVAERQPGWFEVRARRMSDPPGTLLVSTNPATCAMSGTVTNP